MFSVDRNANRLNNVMSDLFFRRGPILTATEIQNQVKKHNGPFDSSVRTKEYRLIENGKVRRSQNQL